VDVSLPCRCVIPWAEKELFRPGILVESEGGDVLARMALTESSRFVPAKGFWRRLGQVFAGAPLGTVIDKTRFDLVMKMEDATVWTLQGRADRWSDLPRVEVLDGRGEPAGRIEVKTSGWRGYPHRTTFLDASDEEIGYVELSLSPFSATCRFVDVRRRWEYALDAARKAVVEPGCIRSRETDVIDSRLLLAWCYYNKFYLAATSSDST
jgi:hypothetical protein